jgi:signal transduction histidine kinase
MVLMKTITQQAPGDAVATEGLGAGASRSGTWLGRTLRRAGLDLAYLTIGMLTAIVAFVVWVAGLSISVSLAVFIVGLVAAIGTIYAFRWSADLDRQLARLALGEPIARRYRPVPPDAGWLGRLGTLLRDPQTWRDLLWLIAHSVIGFGLGVAALTLVGTAIGSITIPAWWTFLPDDAEVFWYPLDSWEAAWLTAALGVGLAVVAVPVLRLMTVVESRLARLLLSPSSKERLEARVQRLATTRAGAVEAAQTDLERIERDLHDGAQARLVALAMELGMAEERALADPEAAREMVARARGEALTALAELRDLARGMRPALLAERGLRAAVEALAARSPLPVWVSFEGEVDGAPQRYETAAYFVVAEALTNAAKHAGADRIEIAIRRDARLTVQVTDDGRGGADPAGAGLSGLRQRVEALDGALSISSPAGGPTTIRADLPGE